MNEYGAVKNQMDGMIRDIEELQAENEKLKAENKKLKRPRVFIPKPIDFSGDGLLFAPEGIKQLYNGEEVEKIVKEREEYKHRAEVAERALRNITERASCNICDNFSCRYYDGINYDYNAEDCIKWWLAQAEKELAEEEKE